MLRLSRGYITERMLPQPLKSRIITGDLGNVIRERYSIKFRVLKRLAGALCLSLLGLAAVTHVSPAAALPGAAVSIKPYRVLLVVDHWSDPSGLVVNSKTDNFQSVAALLKAWSVPFDVLQLDQQHLDASYLFGRSGSIRYGTVVWVADPSSYGTQDIASLEQATQAGTSLIAFNSRFVDPVLERLLGLKFREFYTATDDLHLTGEHYITRGIGSAEDEMPPQKHDYAVRLWVQPTSANVLITQGQHPVLTANQIAPGVSAVWLGSPAQPELGSSIFWRNLLFRSLVWTMGYAVVPNVDFDHSIIFELDDWGTADKAFLSYWRYVEPSAETISQYLVAPLQQHHAVASAMVDTGYVDRQSKRVVSPWAQKFTDLYGLNQDYASTRQGLKQAVAEGLLNIESHGWTHMNQDLESPPGPWWTADLSGAGSVDGWYAEFDDKLRGNEVPAVTQMFHMKRSLSEIQQDFGEQALEFKPGNNSWSKTQFNNTAELAARVGFGLFHGDDATYYLTPERVLDMAGVIPDFTTGYDILDRLHSERWPAHPDGPVIVGFHDRDIALDHDFMQKLFAALPSNYKTLGTNEYIGMLHTQVSSSAGNNNLQLTFDQDSHYCTYFATHPSSWQLWLSEPLRQQLMVSHTEVSVDNKPARKMNASESQPEMMIIDLPPGVGSHNWGIDSGNTRQ